MNDLQAETDGSLIHIIPAKPTLDLLALEREGYLHMEGKEIIWNTGGSGNFPRELRPIHYRQDQLARLANPNLTYEERAVLRLQLCAKGKQWRAGLAVWRQLVQETPALAETAPARRELLTLAAAMLQQLAHAEKPTAPAELCTTITENLRAEDFTDLGVSLALAQAAKAVLAMDAVFTPPLPVEVCEAFRAHLLRTAPKTWLEAVMLNP